MASLSFSACTPIPCTQISDLPKDGDLAETLKAAVQQGYNQPGIFKRCAACSDF